MSMILIAAALAAHAAHGEHRPAQLRSGLISDDDYPASALSARAEGTVVARYVVGADGRVSSCEVITSSGNSALDSTTCSLIQGRFRFSPAVDGDGKAVEDQKTHRVAWRLPPPPEPAEPVAAD